ncbi:MAG: uroporphyrinogen-III synthase, partial [Myxococcales bacterium]
SPAVTVIGDVVALRERLKWLERLPLFGRSIVVTRARAQAGEMSAQLEELGAEVIEAPTIAIAPPESYAPLDHAIATLHEWDWLVLTSANGVEHFLRRLAACGRDARALAGIRIATVGSATSQTLREAHLTPDAVPHEFNAEALSRVLAATGVAGKRFLVVRALEGREVLPEELRRLGAHVHVVPAYRTVRPDIDVAPLRKRLEERRVSAVTFASSSAVRNFAGHFAPGELRTLLDGVAIGVIGPVTEAAVHELGLEVAVRPAEATIPALVAALVSHLNSGERGR